MVYHEIFPADNCFVFENCKKKLITAILENSSFLAKSLPLRARMKHCKLHSLLGEACFGDIVFSLFKRRNASLHHQSTINMLKRNQTMSGWFSKQSATEQKCYLLWQKHHSVVRQVREKLKVKLQENKAKVETSKRELRQRKEAIAGAVRQHGGHCLSLTDVDRLMIDVAGGKSQFLKNEISYKKPVLGRKRKFLKIIGHVATLTQNLKYFFRCKDDQDKSQIIFDSPFLYFTTKYKNVALCCDH